MKKDKTYLILRGKNNSYLIDLSKEELIQKLSELFFEEKVQKCLTTAKDGGIISHTKLIEERENEKRNI